MTRLVPEQRTDRTGRTQTRWVLPLPQPTARAVPAPAIGPEADRSAALSFVLQYVEDGDERADADLLQQCSPVVLERLAENLRAEGGLGKGLVVASGRWYRFDTHLRWAMIRLRRGDRAPLQNLAVFYDAVSGPEWLTAAPNLWELIDGLTYPWGNPYTPPFAGVQDFSGLPEDRLRQAWALVYAAHRLGDDFTEGRGEDPMDDEDGARPDGPLRRVIHDAGMVRLLMIRPDDAEVIVRIVNEEHIRDVRVIREKLESPSRALSDGVL